MPPTTPLSPYSLGVGDRFAHQARAQLQACLLAREQGIDVTPVWNKSRREHTLIGSEPAQTRQAAEAAVRALGWTGPYFVDADHIRLDTVEPFLAACDFFTLDLADFIGAAPEASAVEAFARRHPELSGWIEIPGLESPWDWRAGQGTAGVAPYLRAVREAGCLFRRIAAAKGPAGSAIEVSMDETDTPQSAGELLVILAALADEGVPVHTLAPKFRGRFNKGVDYVGSVEQLERDFQEWVCVVAYAAHRYGLPAGLKLSVHSGSDKFSIYPALRRVLQARRAGLHLKTAGTTWLEECAGLAEAGGEGLAIVREIYEAALTRSDELCRPYATVIDIDRAHLPSPSVARGWSSEQWVAALTHEPRNPAFNPHLRQLLHVAFRVAAEMGTRFLAQLESCASRIGPRVTANLWERHLQPLFGRPRPA